MLFEKITVVQADGTLLPGRYVGTQGAFIRYLGTEAPQGDWGERIDGTHGVLMPGLVNSHTHVPMTLMRGYGDDLPLDTWLFDRIFPFEDKLTADAVYWGSLLGMAEMLSTGTTSFSDMYCFCDSVARAALECGIKANIGRGISCFDPGQKFSNLPACREMEELFATVHGAGDGRILIDVAPHSEYTTRPDILYDAANFAARYHARLQVHLSETRKEQLECVGRHGKTPARVMEESGVLDRPVTAAHCVWLTQPDMEILAAHPVTVAHCAKSNLKLASGIAPVPKLRKMGIPVAIGTDSAASNNSLDMFEEMRTATLLAKGIARDPLALPAGETLFMATRQGALSQGREDCGDIREGFRADLVILDTRRTLMTPCHSALSNLLYAANGSVVALTMADGRVVYRNGEFPGLDIEKIRWEAVQAVNKILER